MKLDKHNRIQAIIQGSLWTAVGTGLTLALYFPNFDSGAGIGPFAATALISIACFFSGTLAAVGAIIATRKDYAAGKIELTSEDREAASKQPPLSKPYWLSSTVLAVIQAVVLTIVAAAVFYLVFGAGVPRAAFVIITAASMGLNGAFIASHASRRELLKAIAHPITEPAPFHLYIWREHVLGSALINYGINALVTYVMYHKGPKFPYDSVPMSTLSIDIAVMCLLVSVLTALNSEMQATGDVGFGETTGPGPELAGTLGIASRLLSYAGIAIASAAFCVGALYLATPDGVTLWWVMTLKGIVAAVVSGVAAALGAYWSILRARAMEEESPPAAATAD